MKRGKILWLIAISIIVVVAMFAGCVDKEQQILIEQPEETESAAGGQTITVGETVKVGTATISSDGGTISVNKSGHLLDGLIIGVPEGAYSAATKFEISYSPIEEHSLGKYFNPISPLIDIENGAGYAQELMIVKIPVSIPDGYFAMAFFYNEDTGELEGIPVIAEDENSITVATLHFSNIAVTIIKGLFLVGDVSSGFMPDKDGWQFINKGSYVSPRGHCGGQSISALYYYNDKKQKEGKAGLYGLYDNNGDTEHKTLLFDPDDELAIKLCSAVQEQLDVNAEAAVRWFERGMTRSDWDTYDSFAYSLSLNNEPQLVLVYNGGDEGHAMIVYGKSGVVTRDGSEVIVLYVSDPNYPYIPGFPAPKREIIFDISTGKFKPYISGPNADDLGHPYPVIYYMGKTAMINWSKMNQLWNEFEAKTIGKDIFPVYSLKVIKDKPDGSTEEIKLKNGHKTNDGRIKIKVESDFVPKLLVYDAHRPYVGAEIGKVEGKGGTVEIALKQGTNRIGFYVEGKKGGGWHWAGFDWMNVVYEEKEEVEPADEFELPVTQCDASKDLELSVTDTRKSDTSCSANLKYKNTGTETIRVYAYRYGYNYINDVDYSGWYTIDLDPGEEDDYWEAAWYYGIEDYGAERRTSRCDRNTMFVVALYYIPHPDPSVSGIIYGAHRCKWIAKDLIKNGEPPQGLTIINVEDLNPCKDWSPK
uniref:Uncharacterized protein n=1 Tax=Candidatus Methanophaga sp. ANME-1 ERB7 TaxID=2759913 RepID=A0A7G9Z6D4_9EURY|nr:hypothetical protein LEBEIBBM_00033 [Methanosarcinales archaeon ANME-1 ERB7]